MKPIKPLIILALVSLVLAGNMPCTAEAESNSDFLIPMPAATLLVSQDAEVELNGQSFLVDGAFQGSNPELCAPVLGLAVTDVPALNAVIAALTEGNGKKKTSHAAQFHGAPGDLTIEGQPSIAQIDAHYTVDYLQWFASILKQRTPYVFPNDTKFKKKDWEKYNWPAIVYIAAEDGNFTREVHLNGDLVGTGILVVEGHLRLNGTFRWDGLVLALGDGSFRAEGDAVVEGAVVLVDTLNAPSAAQTHLNLSGNASILFNCDALNTGFQVANHAPQIVSTPVASVLEDEEYLYEVIAEDVDAAETLQYRLLESPEGMVIDANTGLIQWLPDNTDVGTHTVTVEVRDIFDATDVQTYGLEVINMAPVVTSTSITQMTEDVPYTYNVESDDEGLGAVYTLTDNPTGMTIDAETGLIQWLPNNADVGEHLVTVRVDDGNGGTGEQTYTLTVVNVPPTITSEPVVLGTEDALYTYDVACDDEGQGATAYSLGQAPAGMQIDVSTGVVTWTPNNANVGEHSVTIDVDDGNGGTTQQTFTLTVENVAPIITSTPVTEATEEVAYSYDVDSTDEGQGATAYELVTFPEGMAIDSATGLINWTPTNSQSEGEHAVQVRVDDGNGGTDMQSFDIVVANVNDAPTITSTPVTDATEEVAYLYGVEADDDDLHTLNPTERLTYQLIQGPAGMTIDETTGQLTWMPTNAQAEGSHNVSVQVTDVAGETATQAFTITVANVNDQPVITSTPITEATQGEAYVYDVEADDDDRHTLNPTELLTYSLLESPAGMTIDPTTGLVNWTPTNEQAGETYSVAIQVSDGEATAEQLFDITVAIVDVTPPVITNLTPASGSEIRAPRPTISADYSADFSGIDTSTVNLTLDGDDVTAFADVTETNITYIPSIDLDEGQHVVTVDVSDIVGNTAVQAVSAFTILSADTDGDGMPDDYEIAHGLDPNNPDDASQDPDGDGLTNLQEFTNGSNPHNPDTDGDLLLDSNEVSIGTNPANPNTDGDGISDGNEINLGTNPLVFDDPATTDLVISGHKVTLNGAITVRSISVINGGCLTHPTATTTQTYSLILNVETLDIEEGSCIDVTGKGYLGGGRGDNTSPQGRTLNNALGSSNEPPSGGSYGGLGSNRASNPIYSDFTNPNELGSGGGLYFNNWQVRGGNGGGLAKIQADTITLNGSILANGENSQGVSSTSGSGGGINIHVQTLTGTGLIAANGGRYVHYDGFGGGGGRVAIYYESLDPTITITAAGGIGKWDWLGERPQYNGGVGTIFLQNTAQAHRELILDNGGLNTTAISELTPPEGYTFDRVTVRNRAQASILNAITTVTLNVTFSATLITSQIVAQDISLSSSGVLTHPGATTISTSLLDITTTSLSIDANSKIDVTAKGYLGGRRGDNTSYQGRTLNNALGSSGRCGGGYGGLGGTSSGVSNPVYGDFANPNELGSGGGTANWQYPGGNGGGLLKIEVDTITLNGSILANGENRLYSGCGSGGGINISVKTLTGGGRIAVDGGRYLGGSGFGGGGGRVAIYCESLDPTITITAAGGIGKWDWLGERPQYSGKAGTVFLQMMMAAPELSRPAVTPQPLSKVMPPTTTIVNPSNLSILNQHQLTVRGTAQKGSESGIQRVEVSADDGQTWMPAKGTTNWVFQWRPAQDGIYNIRVRAIDTAGNREIPVNSIRIIVDTTKPTVMPLVPTPKVVKPGGRVMLQAKVSDALSGLVPYYPVTIDLTPIGGTTGAEMYDDGNHGDSVANDGIFSVQFRVPAEVPDGIKQLVITAQDKAGHIENTVAFTLTVVSKSRLMANFPNPFNPETWIPYSLVDDADVTIRIYNAAGRLVKTLSLGHQAAGLYTSRTSAAYWNGRNDAGERVSTGVYFYTISAGRFTATRRMLLVK